MKVPAIVISRFGKAGKKAREARRKVERFADGSRWNHGGELARRRYASYDEYLDHQSSKLAGVADQLVRNQPRDLADFLERFETCAPLREAHTVLCLGARLGTEVKALRQLGYLAVGIDLNPGADNVYVMHGDFHDLAFPTGSFDAVYTNALDHAFDLARILAEVRRVLKPGGLLVVDLCFGSEEGRLAGDFEALWWRDSQAMIDRLAALGQFDTVEARELRQVRQGRWRQAVLRKSASDTGAELVVVEPARKLDSGAGPDWRAARALVTGGRGRATTSRGRPNLRRPGRLRTVVVFASCLLGAAVAGFFMLRAPTPKVDQPQRTWATPPPT
jgi:SAM-dependent methyltransferase